MVDAQRSERCERKLVEVRVLSSARRGGGIGRHAALRGLCRKRCAGSNPVLGTI